MRKLRLLASAIPCSGFVAASLAGLMVTGLTSVAHAAAVPATFAQFQEVASSNPNQFEYLDNGATTGDAEFGTDAAGVFGAPIPVTFSFLGAAAASLPADLQGVQNATLTLTSSTTEGVQSALMGMLGSQVFDASGAQMDVLTITRDTPAAEGNGTKTNLLTMVFTDDMVGMIGGRTPQIAGNTPGDQVDYSSDFLSLPNTGESNFSLTFSSWITAADNGGLELSPTAGDNFFASATAAGTGTFDTAIPEPVAGGLAVTGLMAVFGGRRRRAAK